ncbi:UDP-glucose 4-epimerase GalE [Virgibacillus proomii]|uniref:UDP-glucose 4-epimerase GalE n=1 Tax=Virgibacillus proomii TaxID=84407 RepID=UPI001C119E6B|nr:UDP-glucose 4-epimerase GalE [Virgibacillus proomii]MBU5268064.1 UDP-glucose 4-epimerase GalE [Virgibacillus proomii]
MTILVTGGAGFIGSHATVELLESGYDVVVIDNLVNSDIEAIKRVKELTGIDFPFYQYDLLSYKQLQKLFKTYKFEAVMHFAGLKAVGESIEIPINYYHNNITGTINLCRVMDEYGVNKLVFSSSATVYGNPSTVPIYETFPLSVTNPYGRTKLIIEEFLKDLSASNPKWRVVLLRYFNPIGAHESGRIGEDPKGIPNNLMPYITQVAIGKRDKLKVFGNDYNTHDGTGVRDFIHVVDLVKGHINALNFLEKTIGIEIFNLGTGQGYSVLDLINTFSSVTSIDIPYEIVERRPGDIAICYASPDKAKKILKWEAEKSLRDMCKDSWNWQINNPNGYRS